MSTTYVLDHPEQGRIEYTDKKRHLWMSSLFMPLLPFDVPPQMIISVPVHTAVCP